MVLTIVMAGHKTLADRVRDWRVVAKANKNRCYNLVELKLIFQMFTWLAFFKRQHGLPHFYPDSGFLCPHCDNSLHICHNVYKDPPCATNGVRRDAKAVFEEKSDSSHPGARHEHLFPSLLDALRGRLNAHHVFRRRKLPEKVFFNHTWNYHTI